MKTKPNTPSITPVLVDTNTAAHLLSLTPQTLREWSSQGRGALIPVRVGNRLRWSMADIMSLASQTAMVN